MSIDSNGTQATGGDSHRPSISADVRFIVFHSDADNLVAGDTNAETDVFVRDRLLGTTRRVSVDSTGAQALGGASLHPIISADGSVVVFGSDATNLVAGDTNSFSDVFAHELASGITTRVSVSTTGVESAGGHSHWPTVSSDGRFVAFYSRANNLVANDGNGSSDIFVRDRMANVTSLVSQNSSGVQQSGECAFPVISADARFVAFVCNADDLVAGDNNGATDVFLRDRLLATTVRVSVNSLGAEGTGASTYPSISADGRFVAFSSFADNLVVGDTNNVSDVFVHDAWSPSTVRVSVSSSSTQAMSGSTNAALSSDGRYVTFRSSASNLVSGDANATPDIFLHDRSSGVTELVSLDSSGAQANASCDFSSVSVNGRYVVFDSFADTLTQGDSNGTQDVFVRDRGAFGAVSYCTAGTTTNGCTATMAASGSASIAASSGFTVTASGLEGQKQGLLFYGLDNNGFTPLAWGASSSYLCVKSPKQRTPAQDSGGTSGACDGILALDFNAYFATHPSALGQPLAVGQHVFVQAWFRDPPSAKTTNLSNAIEFEVGP